MPPVFTFDNSNPVVVFENDYIQIPITVEPNPLNPPDITFQNGPNGLGGYQFTGGDYVYYGNPVGLGDYTVDFTATNIAGEDHRSLTVQVVGAAYNVSNAQDPQFDGQYLVSEQGFFYFDIPSQTVQEQYGYATIGLTMVWRNTNNSNLAIVYFQTYDAWIIVDLSTWTGLPPTMMNVNATQYGNANPPTYSWLSADNLLTVDRVPAP